MRLFTLAVSGCIAATLVGAAHAGSSVLIHDDFSDLQDWDDLSTVVEWNGASSVGDSIFDTSGGQVTLTQSAQSRIGFGAGTTRMFQALDRQFASPVDRSGGLATITVDFRAMWDPRQQSNEGSRLVVSLNHDYPGGGLDLTPEGTAGSRIDDFTFNNGAAWARPAYNLRIRLQNDESLMMFGGGPEFDGEFENNGAYWFPGFSSAPGGGSPQPSSDGVVGAGTGNFSQSQFLDYRWVLGPTRQQLFVDFGSGYQLRGTQDLTSGDGTGVRFDFDTIEGIRLFWRGQDGRSQAMIDSLKVTVDVVPEPTSLGLIGLAGLALIGRRRSGRRSV